MSKEFTEPPSSLTKPKEQAGLAASGLLDSARWEYLCGDMERCWPDEEQKKLNELGKEGWELVTCIRLPNETRFYMKRPSNLELKRAGEDSAAKAIKI